MQITFTPAALRQWTKLDVSVRKRIKAKIETFAETGSGDAKKLQGRAGSRLRVGDFRVIFYTEGQIMVIVAVGDRRDVYD